VDDLARGRAERIAGLIERGGLVLERRGFSPTRARAIVGARISDIYHRQARRMEAATRTADFATPAGRRLERQYDRAFACDRPASIDQLVIDLTGTRTLAADVDRGCSTRVEGGAYDLLRMRRAASRALPSLSPAR
jgi:hypothetical protein